MSKVAYWAPGIGAVLMWAGAAAAQEPGVRAVELDGSGQIPVAGPPAAPPPARGTIAFNLPAADPQVVARAVLGDILHLPFAVAPGVAGQVNAVTPYPLAKAAVLPFLEEALRAAHLALVRVNGVYTIMPADQARGQPAGDGAVGFGSQIVALQFVSAAQIKALLDPILPGVVAATDAGANTLTLAGTSGQRANAREIIAQFDVNWLRRMSFALIIPQRSDARLIVPELDKLLNAPDAPTRQMVRLIAMDKLNGILAVSAQPQFLADARRWIEVLDREGQNNEEQLFVYHVQNGRSKDLAKTLNTAFGMGGASADPARPASDAAAPAGAPPATAPAALPAGAPAAGAPGTGARRLGASISSDDNNNAVIIFGTPHDYGIVLAALRKLDVPPMQVMLEAAVTEVSLTDNTSFGLQWQYATSGNGATVNGALTNSTTAPDLTQVAASNLAAAAPGFSMLFTHGTNIASVLSAMQAHSKINVVSAPKLLVLNNQTAALQVGDQVPILTQSSTSTVGNSAVINSVDYKDTGVILKITPRVNESGLVMLDVSQEVSSVKNTTTSGISSPTISTRKIASTVAVQDGEVIALGGLISNSVTRTKNGVPLLSQLPLVGALFGTHGDIKDRTELVVLIKPHVLRTLDDAREVTDELREKLKGAQAFAGATAGAIP